MADGANIDAAAQLAVKYEIVPAEAVAKAAIPDSGLVFIAGADAVKASLNGYFQVLMEADPKSIGGALPDDTFYYKSA